MARSSSSTKLRWFQVGLRDILALGVVCCILLAWWNDHRRLSAFADGSAREAEDQRAEVLRLQEELIAAHVQPAADEPLEGCRFDLPPVNGLVLWTRPEKGIVKINVGSDDGLKLDDRLEVIRLASDVASSTYLGKVQLISVAPTKAVAKVLYVKGTIEVNDHVATLLE